MENIYFLQELQNNIFQILVTLIAAVLYFIMRLIITRLINRHAKKNSIDISRKIYIRKLSNYLIFLLFFIIVAGVWEISFKGLSLGFASVFTVIGVALFAHWSILSNLTASIIIYFFFPFKIGGKIIVLEGDNSIKGTIMDISLFYINIKTDDQNLISIPNNLVFQKIMQYQ